MRFQNRNWLRSSNGLPTSTVNHDRRRILTDRQIVVEEEILNKEEAAKFLKIGTDNFTKLYGVCGDRQGGKTVTYKKSVILDRYDALCKR